MTTTDAALAARSATPCPTWCAGYHPSDADPADMRHCAECVNFECTSGRAWVLLAQFATPEAAEAEDDDLEVGANYVVLVTPGDDPVILTPDEARRLGSLLRALGKSAGALE